VEPEKLRPARKIIQREYRGWALLLVARSFGAEGDELDAAQERIAYAKQAVDEFDAGLNLMGNIMNRYGRGEGGQEMEGLYRWLTKESFDIERSKYLKAVAIAVIARAGGHRTRADVRAELAGISPAYLLSYPPDDNPDLKWARHSEEP
ncbi:MAG: hypothetical protein JOZ15_20815, partial [Acidobacteria bacterium]|nr:hypothetical protein [Acidobacteriota bacterium]